VYSFLILTIIVGNLLKCTVVLDFDDFFGAFG